MIVNVWPKSGNAMPFSVTAEVVVNAGAGELLIWVQWSLELRELEVELADARWWWRRRGGRLLDDERAGDDHLMPGRRQPGVIGDLHLDGVRAGRRERGVHGASRAVVEVAVVVGVPGVGIVPAATALGGRQGRLLVDDRRVGCDRRD